MRKFSFRFQIEKRAAQEAVREVRREAKLSKVSTRQLKFAELQEEDQQELMVANRQKKARAKQSLEDRLAAEEEEGGSVMRTETGHTFTFKTEKSRWG